MANIYDKHGNKIGSYETEEERRWREENETEFLVLVIKYWYITIPLLIGACLLIGW